MSNLKVHVQKHNSHSRSFHTNVTVGKTAIEHYDPTLRRSYSDVYAKHGRIVANMIYDLLRIDGLDCIFVKPYDVSVHMDTFFNKPSPAWNEKIDQIVRNAFEQLYQEELRSSAKRVLVNKHSAHMRHFDTKFQLSQSIHSFSRPLAEYHDVYLRQIGPDAARLVRKISALPGVTSVFVNTYELTVYIAPAFNWAEKEDGGESLEDQVKKMLEDIYGPINFTDK